MIKSFELLIGICMAILLLNFVTILNSIRKKEVLSKVVYFINNIGIFIISNVAVWMEGIFIDENNLPGSKVSFYLHIINIIFCIVNVFLTLTNKETKKL